MFVEFTRRSGFKVSINTEHVTRFAPAATPGLNSVAGPGTDIYVSGEVVTVKEEYEDVLEQLNIASQHLADTLRTLLPR